MRARYFAVATALCLGLVSPRTATTQEAPADTLCKRLPCGLIVDWGVGGTAGCQRMGSSPQLRNCIQAGEWGNGGTPEFVDPRYGPPSEFRGRVNQYLAQAGYIFTDELKDVKLKIFLRPEIARAHCDFVTGTGSAESCRTIGRVRVEFQGDHPADQRPKDFRVMNRCGNGEFMTVARFALYTAETLDRVLSPDKNRPRPSLQCRL